MTSLGDVRADPTPGAPGNAIAKAHSIVASRAHVPRNSSHGDVDWARNRPELDGVNVPPWAVLPSDLSAPWRTHDDGSEPTDWLVEEGIARRGAARPQVSYVAPRRRRNVDRLRSHVLFAPD